VVRSRGQILSMAYVHLRMTGGGGPAHDDGGVLGPFAAINSRNDSFE
jgi:hypothetical protein